MSSSSDLGTTKDPADPQASMSIQEDAQKGEERLQYQGKPLKRPRIRLDSESEEEGTKKTAESPKTPRFGLRPTTEEQRAQTPAEPQTILRIRTDSEIQEESAADQDKTATEANKVNDTVTDTAGNSAVDELEQVDGRQEADYQPLH